MAGLLLPGTPDAVLSAQLVVMASGMWTLKACGVADFAPLSVER
jgi:hypothetical protein